MHHSLFLRKNQNVGERISDFEGAYFKFGHTIKRTWVAFLDLCGFKQMVKEHKAEAALDKFYNTIFKINETYPYRYQIHATNLHEDIQPSIFVSRIVVSDCAVIFVDNTDAPLDQLRNLKLILTAVSKINRRLIDKRNNDDPQLMTTCAIDYGRFKYVDRTVDEHVEKSFYYGTNVCKRLFTEYSTQEQRRLLSSL